MFTFLLEGEENPRDNYSVSASTKSLYPLSPKPYLSYNQ